jgi:hypothetical protein
VHHLLPAHRLPARASLGTTGRHIRNGAPLLYPEHLGRHIRKNRNSAMRLRRARAPQQQPTGAHHEGQRRMIPSRCPLNTIASTPQKAKRSGGFNALLRQVRLGTVGTSTPLSAQPRCDRSIRRTQTVGRANRCMFGDAFRSMLMISVLSFPAFSRIRAGSADRTPSD